MPISLRERTGEELLLMKVFGGQSCERSVDRELERRASEGPNSPLALIRRLRQPVLTRRQMVA